MATVDTTSTSSSSLVQGSLVKSQLARLFFLSFIFLPFVLIEAFFLQLLLLQLLEQALHFCCCYSDVKWPETKQKRASEKVKEDTAAEEARVGLLLQHSTSSASASASAVPAKAGKR